MSEAYPFPAVPTIGHPILGITDTGFGQGLFGGFAILTPGSPGRLGTGAL